MPEILLFLVSSIAVTVAPGPDNMQVLARGISQGRAAGLAAACGFAAGVLFHTALAAFGIASILSSSPLLFGVIKYAGAAYLIWIGIAALRSSGSAGFGERPPLPLRKIFVQSVLGNMLNPKVTLFFMVFLPQFVDPQRAAVPQMLMLGALFILQTLAVFSLFALFAGTAGSWMRRRPAAGKWLERFAGLVFVSLGLRVALQK